MSIDITKKQIFFFIFKKNGLQAAKIDYYFIFAPRFYNTNFKILKNGF